MIGLVAVSAACGAEGAPFHANGQAGFGIGPRDRAAPVARAPKTRCGLGSGRLRLRGTGPVTSRPMIRNALSCACRLGRDPSDVLLCHWFQAEGLDIMADGRRMARQRGQPAGWSGI